MNENKKMKTFKVTVAFPIYLTVNAKNKEEAEQKALDKADYYLETSSVEPIIHEIEETEGSKHPNIF